MISFDRLYEQACQHKGSADAVNALLPAVQQQSELSQISDERWLAMMTKCIFQAGFVWRVIEAKWPNFETVFDGFHPAYWAQVSPEVLTGLAKDERIVRNAQKINTVPVNAQMLLDMQQTHGGMSQWLIEQNNDLPAIYQHLAKQGSRLGGNSAMYLLRIMGKDTYLYTDSVSTALRREQVITGALTSKKAKLAAHEAFLTWQQQSNFSLAQLSKLLALTVSD